MVTNSGSIHLIIVLLISVKLGSEFSQCEAWGVILASQIVECVRSASLSPKVRTSGLASL